MRLDSVAEGGLQINISLHGLYTDMGLNFPVKYCKYYYDVAMETRISAKHWKPLLFPRY